MLPTFLLLYLHVIGGGDLVFSSSIWLILCKITLFFVLCNSKKGFSSITLTFNFSKQNGGISNRLLQCGKLHFLLFARECLKCYWSNFFKKITLWKNKKDFYNVKFPYAAKWQGGGLHWGVGIKIFAQKNA